MSKELANRLRIEFFELTGIECLVEFMDSGKMHKPSRLKSNEKGVYVFLLGNHCFKIGKANSNSQPRWNSHHYNLDKTTPSTLPKSIKKNVERFKQFLPKEKHAEIDQLCPGNFREWIENNTSRIEFKMSSSESDFALNLLEALLQFRLKPIFEGKSA